MNPFIEHHQQSIRFQYSCFDRMLLNAVVQPMQQPARLSASWTNAVRCRPLPRRLPRGLRRLPPLRCAPGCHATYPDRRATQRRATRRVGRAVLSALRLALRDRRHPQEPRERLSRRGLRKIVDGHLRRLDLKRPGLSKRLYVFVGFGQAGAVLLGAWRKMTTTVGRPSCTQVAHTLATSIHRLQEDRFSRDVTDEWIHHLQTVFGELDAPGCQMAARAPSAHLWHSGAKRVDTVRAMSSLFYARLARMWGQASGRCVLHARSCSQLDWPARAPPAGQTRGAQ